MSEKEKVDDLLDELDELEEDEANEENGIEETSECEELSELEEITILLANGPLDDKLLNRIVVQYEYIINIYIKKYNVPTRDQEDVMQEGRIGILKAARGFKLGRGANFTTFVSLCIKRQIITYIRNCNRKKHVLLRYGISFDSKLESMYFDRIISNVNTEEEVINKLHYQEAYQQASRKLNKIEAKIYQCYATGYSINELSTKYDVPKKQIYVIIARARKKIQEELKNN